MAKYHITERGEPARCFAHFRPCPNGGADQHYDSKEEARSAFEATMSEAACALAGVKARLDERAAEKELEEAKKEEENRVARGKLKERMFELTQDLREQSMDELERDEEKLRATGYNFNWTALTLELSRRRGELSDEGYATQLGAHAAGHIEDAQRKLFRAAENIIYLRNAERVKALREEMRAEYERELEGLGRGLGTKDRVDFDGDSGAFTHDLTPHSSFAVQPRAVGTLEEEEETFADAKAKVEYLAPLVDAYNEFIYRDRSDDSDA